MWMLSRMRINMAIVRVWLTSKRMRNLKAVLEKTSAYYGNMQGIR